MAAWHKARGVAKGDVFKCYALGCTWKVTKLLPNGLVVMESTNPRSAEKRRVPTSHRLFGFFRKVEA